MGGKYSFETKYSINDVVQWRNDDGYQYGKIESFSVFSLGSEKSILVYNVGNKRVTTHLNEQDIDCLMIERRE